MAISLQTVKNIATSVGRPAEGILFSRKITIPRQLNPQNLRFIDSGISGRDIYTFNIQNSAQKRLSPKELDNIRQAFKDMRSSSLQGLETTKGLDAYDLYLLNKQLSAETSEFILMSLGARPAMATGYPTSIVEKIKSKNFDIIIEDANNYAVIINKEAAFENICRNKNFYTQRLSLPKTATDEDVYKILTGDNSPLRYKTNSDIIGMILGFPRKDNMIFQLERSAGLDYTLRENLPKYKEALLKELHSPNCVYAKFDDTFKKELEDAINSIKSIKHSEELGLPYGYQFINFVDDTPEIARINKSIREATSKMEKINTANQKAADEEFWHNLTDTDPQKQLEEFAKSMQEEAAKLQTTTNPQNIMDNFFKSMQEGLASFTTTPAKNPFDNVI